MSSEYGNYEARLERLMSGFLFSSGEIEEILRKCRDDTDGAKGFSSDEMRAKYYQVAVERLEPLQAAVDKAMESFSLRHRENLAQCFYYPNNGWMGKFTQIRDRLGQGGQFLVVGPPGSGKTQLGTALAHRLVERRVFENVAGSVAYVTLADLFIRIKATFRSGARETEHHVISSLMRHSFLVIDEIYEINEDDWAGRVFTRLIDQRYCEKRDTLLLSNRPVMKLMEGLGECLKDRMRETGFMIEFDWPSFRGRH